MDKFLGTYNLSKQNQEELENMNRKIIPSEIEAVITIFLKSFQQTKALDKMASQVNFTTQRTPVFLKLFQKIQEEGRLPISFYKFNIILIPKPEKAL